MAALCCLVQPGFGFPELVLPQVDSARPSDLRARLGVSRQAETMNPFPRSRAGPAAGTRSAGLGPHGLVGREGLRAGGSARPWLGQRAPVTKTIGARSELGGGCREGPAASPGVDGGGPAGLQGAGCCRRQWRGAPLCRLCSELRLGDQGWALCTCVTGGGGRDGDPQGPVAMGPRDSLGDTEDVHAAAQRTPTLISLPC